jgi:hypothetical protein
MPKGKSEKLDRLVELAEGVRDTFTCTQEGCEAIFGDFPHDEDEIVECWHCFARWALGETGPETRDDEDDEQEGENAMKPRLSL